MSATLRHHARNGARPRELGRPPTADRRLAPAHPSKGPMPYCRARDLPRLLALWPREIADTSPTGQAHMVVKLRQALRAERRRGAAGHWTYDVARHAQLLAAYRAERSEHEKALAAARRECASAQRNG